MRSRSSENVKHLSINDFTTNIRFAMGEMRRLSPLNYSVFSNSKDLQDAVFCGGITSEQHSYDFWHCEENGMKILAEIEYSEAIKTLCYVKSCHNGIP